MVTVTVVLDGAADPGGRSLARAATPALDALAAAGTTTLRRTVPSGLPAGTETAMPVLLGWTPPRPVARGALEAAARGIDVPAGHRGWRVDRPRRSALRGFVLHELGRDRVLAVGPGQPPPDAGDRVWADGVVPPRVLDGRTVVVAAIGAAAGSAALLGARVVVPAGATGDVDSDLRAKAAAALAALEDADRVVVHVGAPDAAAHRRDADAKVAAIAAADRQVVAPLAAALRGRRDAVLEVGADHGCDPATGCHDAEPVAWVRWAA